MQYRAAKFLFNFYKKTDWVLDFSVIFLYTAIISSFSFAQTGSNETIASKILLLTAALPCRGGIYKNKEEQA